MPNARGFIKSDNNRLVGTFDIDGILHHISVAIKPLSQEFKCSNATLTYSNVVKLVEQGIWSDTIGKTDLRMVRGEDATITGPLDAPRMASVCVRGVGRWKTGAEPWPDQSRSANDKDESGSDSDSRFQSAMPGAYDPISAGDPNKLLRERQLLESGNPIIAYASATCQTSP